MKLLFETKTTLFYLLSAILLTTVLLIFYENNQKVLASNTSLILSQDVINKSDEVLIDVLNTETGFRGYLLSGDENFLAPFHEAKSKIYADLEQLKLLTQENPSQQIRVNYLKKSVEERIEFTQKNIDARKHHLLKDSDRIAILKKGKNITDKIRKFIASIKNEEFRQLALQKGENPQKQSIFGITLFVITLFSDSHLYFGDPDY